MSARLLRAAAISHMSDRLKLAVQCIEQVNVDLVSLGWQNDNYLNRQTGQRVTIADATKVLDILARHLAGAKPCAFDGCEYRAEICCDSCDAYCCDEHGSPGGDRQVQDVGAVAYPSACWQHGGYNADADNYECADCGASDHPTSECPTPSTPSEERLADREPA